MTAAGRVHMGDGLHASLRDELRTRLEGLTSLVEPGDTCQFCARAPAVDIVPLAVRDPDARQRLVNLDVLACPTCQAQHAPRAVVSFDDDVTRRLIAEASIDIEAWPRPLFVPSRGAA